LGDPRGLIAEVLMNMMGELVPDLSQTVAFFILLFREEPKRI